MNELDRVRKVMKEYDSLFQQYGMSTDLSAQAMLLHFVGNLMRAKAKGGTIHSPLDGWRGSVQEYYLGLLESQGPMRPISEALITEFDLWP